MSRERAESRQRLPALLWLIVVLPVLSVVFGATLFMVAQQSSDLRMATPNDALNKTSWQKQP
ncbi:MAG: hypothetical protein AAF993_18230 [Pseudomonadota bacterium]